MKKMGVLPLAFTYVGCFLGAGFVSGQELWQFFGAFGGLGFLGFAVAVALFVPHLKSKRKAKTLVKGGKSHA